MTLRSVRSYDDLRQARKSVGGESRNIPASAPLNRKKRRAIVKAIGARQFKKLYRSAKA